MPLNPSGSGPIHAFICDIGSSSINSLEAFDEEVIGVPVASPASTLGQTLPKQPEIISKAQKIKRLVGIVVAVIIWAVGVYCVYSFGAYFGETVAW